MKRWIVGIAALALLIAWAVMTSLGAKDNQTTVDVCLRLGAFLAVLWLALPDAERPRNRMWLGFILISVLVAALRPRLIPLVIVVFLVLAILRPRRPKPAR